MPLKMKPHSTIYANLGIDDNGRVHKYLTATCARHMDRFVPMDTGALAETVVIDGSVTSNVKTDRITYVQPYARYVYYGVGINHYNTDKHADAGMLWDKRMWSADKNDVLEEVQNYVNSGGK